MRKIAIQESECHIAERKLTLLMSVQKNTRCIYACILDSIWSSTDGIMENCNVSTYSLANLPEKQHTYKKEAKK